jgi:hypothetical protein
VVDAGYDVFLSHATEDNELAARVVELLRTSGITVFATGPGFPTGMWSDEVRAALEGSQHFWLLLTEEALERSIYVHHEFGYFFGYHRRENPSMDTHLIARRLRYLRRQDDERRPGMYQHFQDFPIDDFEDPVLVARTIAKEIGSEFKEPDNPKEFRLGASAWSALPPEGLDELEIVGTSSSAAPDYSYGIRAIDVSSPRPIFNVSAIAWHPQVHVWPLRDLPQVGAGRREQLLLRVEWANGENPTEEIQDSYERRFPLQRPRDPGPPWEPIYVTFETRSDQVWGGVTYMKVDKQQHGHPETQLLPGPNPYGWVRGLRP